MEKEIPLLIDVLEKIAVEVGANKAIANDGKGGGFLSKKFGGLSMGKSCEVVDHSADNRAAYLMIKGAMLRATNNTEGAIACFREVISLDNILREKYFVPYCYFELAESLYHNNQLKEAQDAIKKCNNINGYAWEDPLKVRLRVTMDQLKKGGVMEDSEDGASPSLSLVATNGSDSPSLAGKEPSSPLVIEASS